MEQNHLEEICRNFIIKQSKTDAAHDLAHIQRVVSTAKKLLKIEKADPEIVLAAAWLHDCIVLPKNHSKRNIASSLAAEKAAVFLKDTVFANDKLQAVVHAIEAHSYSAGIAPETIEAQIVQDADRIDALGAIGIARCFTVGGRLNIQMYNPEDPFCETREPDDSSFTIDHFYKKLFRLPETLNTESARVMAGQRIQFMQEYLARLSTEI
ncbi:HD domain-containing protein [soil metagenome]